MIARTIYVVVNVVICIGIAALMARLFGGDILGILLVLTLCLVYDARWEFSPFNRNRGR